MAANDLFTVVKDIYEEEWLDPQTFHNKVNVSVAAMMETLSLIQLVDFYALKPAIMAWYAKYCTEICTLSQSHEAFDSWVIYF